MSDLFDTGAITALKRGLDYHLLRHSVIASNIANAETPGYRAQDVSFDSFLAKADQIQTTDPRHMGAGGIQEHEMEAFDDSEASPGNDGNTVSLEREMAKIAANTIRYNAAAEILARRLAVLKYAASDGQRR